MRSPPVHSRFGFHNETSRAEALNFHDKVSPDFS
jgi:hypothetical protein